MARKFAVDSTMPKTMKVNVSIYDNDSREVITLDVPQSAITTGGHIDMMALNNALRSQLRERYNDPKLNWF